MEKERYTIQEAMKILDISKSTIYNRLDKFGKYLEKHTTLSGGKKYIDAVGLDILRKNNMDSLENVSVSTENNMEIMLLKKEIENMFNIIKHKEEQLEIKTNHIESLEVELESRRSDVSDMKKSLDKALQLNENSQVLLKEEKNKVLSLEERTNKKWWKVWN